MNLSPGSIQLQQYTLEWASDVFSNHTPAHHESPRVWFLVSLGTIMMPLDSVVFEDLC